MSPLGVVDALLAGVLVVGQESGHFENIVHIGFVENAEFFPVDSEICPAQKCEIMLDPFSITSLFSASEVCSVRFSVFE